MKQYFGYWILIKLDLWRLMTLPMGPSVQRLTATYFRLWKPSLNSNTGDIKIATVKPLEARWGHLLGLIITSKFNTGFNKSLYLYPFVLHWAWLKNVPIAFVVLSFSQWYLINYSWNPNWLFLIHITVYFWMSIFSRIRIRDEEI